MLSLNLKENLEENLLKNYKYAIQNKANKKKRFSCKNTNKNILG